MSEYPHSPRPSQARMPRERFNYLSAELIATYHDVDNRLGLSHSASTILYSAWEQGGTCPIADVGYLSGIPKQTVNSALRKLEADGIVRLEATKGKRKTICLTEKGADLAQRTVAKIMALEDAVFASWSQADREAYLSLTQRYLTEFKAKSKTLP